MKGASSKLEWCFRILENIKKHQPIRKQKKSKSTENDSWYQPKKLLKKSFGGIMLKAPRTDPALKVDPLGKNPGSTTRNTTSSSISKSQLMTNQVGLF